MLSVTKPKRLSPIINNSSHKLVIECIETALFSLLENKKYEDITISEIINKAGVSRMGFYRNYSSKEEILKLLVYRSFDEVIEDITRERELDFSIESIIRTSLESFKKNSKKMELIIKNNLSYLLYNYYQSAFSAIYQNNDSKYKKYYSAMLIGELYSLEMAWIESGLKETPDELTRIYKIISAIKNNSLK